MSLENKSPITPLLTVPGCRQKLWNEKAGATQTDLQGCRSNLTGITLFSFAKHEQDDLCYRQADARMPCKGRSSASGLANFTVWWLCGHKFVLLKVRASELVSEKEEKSNPVQAWVFLRLTSHPNRFSTPRSPRSCAPSQCWKSRRRSRRSGRWKPSGFCARSSALVVMRKNYKISIFDINYFEHIGNILNSMFFFEGKKSYYNIERLYWDFFYIFFFFL